MHSCSVLQQSKESSASDACQGKLHDDGQTCDDTQLQLCAERHRKTWLPFCFSEVAVSVLLCAATYTWVYDSATAPKGLPQSAQHTTIASIFRANIPTASNQKSQVSYMDETNDFSSLRDTEELNIAGAHLHIHGTQIAPNTPELSDLKQVIEGFYAQGWRVSFYLYDLENKNSISYRSDEEFYPASSVKAPFVLSLF